jgi:chaperonin cofactor prefoldin
MGFLKVFGSLLVLLSEFFVFTPSKRRSRAELQKSARSRKKAEAELSLQCLVAEDVEKVNPDLVVRDTEGKPYTVRYDQVNAMLLNEFLKEHRKVEQFEKQIEALTEGLQKVSAQLEASKPAPQVVNNP